MINQIRLTARFEELAGRKPREYDPHIIDLDGTPHDVMLGGAYICDSKSDDDDVRIRLDPDTLFAGNETFVFHTGRWITFTLPENSAVRKLEEENKRLKAELEELRPESPMPKIMAFLEKMANNGEIAAFNVTDDPCDPYNMIVNVRKKTKPRTSGVWLW